MQTEPFLGDHPLVINTPFQVPRYPGHQKFLKDIIRKDREDEGYRYDYRNPELNRVFHLGSSPAIDADKTFCCIVKQKTLLQ